MNTNESTQQISLTDDDWGRIRSALAFRSTKLCEQGASSSSPMRESCYDEARRYDELIPKVREFCRTSTQDQVPPKIAAALVRIAKAVGISTPLQLIAMAENDDETYAEALARYIEKQRGGGE